MLQYPYLTLDGLLTSWLKQFGLLVNLDCHFVLGGAVNAKLDTCIGSLPKLPENFVLIDVSACLRDVCND
ncbi:MAG: hypothetical protein V2I33_26345, partial [Kangiellaceae bacterium]|nr:hypothetical protein [Kangiellaceae bacterium]